MEKGTFQVVLREEGRDNKVMNGRFALTVKNVGKDAEVHKARFVVRGFTDSRKYRLLHNSTNLRQESAWFLFALAAILGMDVWTQDVSQAFVQGAAEMQDNFLEGPRELQLSADEVLKICRPLYGLCD